MKIERNITFYNKSNGELAGKINIDNIDIDFLSNIVKPPKEDPNLYAAYKINKKLGSKLRDKLNLKFDFKQFDYFLQCYQV